MTEKLPTEGLSLVEKPPTIEPSLVEKLHNESQEQPALPGMELVDVIGAMSPHERIAHKRQWLAEISDREMLCRLVDDANDAEGINVSIIK